MGAELHERSAAARDRFARASETLGYDIADVCFCGPEDKLNSTVYSQPALYVTSLAALAELREAHPDWVEACRYAAGLSLGEYTACAFAGAFDFDTGLKVVQRRGEAMQAAADARDSAMVSVLGLSADQVTEVCDRARLEGEVLAIANYLCPGNIVVSGDRKSVDRVRDIATEAGAMKVIPLAVAGAFHTSIIESAVAHLREALEAAELKRPRIPVVSNVDAQPHDDPSEIRELLIQQVCSPVRWEESMRWLLGESVEHFCEVGPGRVLRGLLKRIHRKADSHGTLN